MGPGGEEAGRDPAPLRQYWRSAGKLPQTVVGTVITAIVAGVVLVLVKLLNEKLRRHLPMPLPEAAHGWNSGGPSGVGMGWGDVGCGVVADWGKGK